MYSVEQTSDGGYIMVGETNSFGAGLKDVYLIKTDALGNVTWSKTYGGTNNDVGRSVKQTRDGGYIIGGWTQSFAGSINFYLIKTTSTGTLSWAYVHGDATNETGYDVIEAPDGGFIIVGEKSMAGTDWDVYVVKTTSTGSFSWANAYGSGSGGGKGTGYKILQDGCNFVILGTADDKGTYTGQANFYLLRINSTGGLLLGKVYDRNNPTTSNQTCFGGVRTSDNGFMLCGYAVGFAGGGGTDVFVVKTSSDGSLLWSKTYGGIGTDKGNALRQTADGGYIIAGETNSYGTGTTWYMLKTDAAGILTWAIAYSGTSNDAAYDVQEVSSYITVGRTSSFGAGTKDVFAIKTDAAGNSVGGAGGCNQFSASTSVETNQTANTLVTDVSTVGAGSTKTTITTSSSTASANATAGTSVTTPVATGVTAPCGTPLPIALLSFDATCNANAVELTWTTASETNNNYFTIERSVDATHFEIIATIQGAGNSNITHGYSFTDNEPYNGVSYYRLKQTDFNGQFKYFNIIAVTCMDDFTGKIKIYPNPVSHQLIIEITGNTIPVNFEIINAIGSVVYKGNLVAKTTVQTINFVSGVYLIKIENGSTFELKKVIIE